MIFNTGGDGFAGVACVRGKSGMAKTSPAEFVRQVRQETAKVTWPTRRETGVSTIMVFIMVTIMALFFIGVDGILFWLSELVFGS